MPVVSGEIVGESLDQLVLMSRVHGGAIYETEHLLNSIHDILTTPKGSRVMRRTYGSNLYLLLDRPINRDLLLDVYYEVAEALRKWEPRIRLSKVKINAVRFSTGDITMDLYGVYRIDGKDFTLNGLSLDFRSANRYLLTLQQ